MSWPGQAASAQGDRRCPQRHPLQVRALDPGCSSCDGCFRKIDVGHGCAICNFDLCDECLVADNDLGALELMVFSRKTCKKVVGAVDNPKGKRRLIQELLGEDRRGRQLKEITGRNLSCRTRFESEVCWHIPILPRRRFASSSYPFRMRAGCASNCPPWRFEWCQGFGDGPPDEPAGPC